MKKAKLIHLRGNERRDFLEALIEQKGDTLNRFVDELTPALLGFVSSIVEDESEVKDVLADVFSVIRQKLPQFNHESDRLLPWVMNVARTVALPKKAETAMGNERSVFRLVYLYGLSIDEVAAKLNTTVVEARKSLRNELQQLTQKGNNG